jgi:hypothetical protein
MLRHLESERQVPAGTSVNPFLAVLAFAILGWFAYLFYWHSRHPSDSPRPLNFWEAAGAVAMGNFVFAVFAWFVYLLTR